MKALIIVVAAFVLVAGKADGQERLSDQLRKGIAQEESGRDVEQAVRTYEALLAQFDGERQAAATAQYRLAECYRKLGRKEQAIAAYRRVVREFPEQAVLVESSRRQLSESFGLSDARPSGDAAEILQRRRELSGTRTLDPSRIREEAGGSRAPLAVMPADHARSLAAAKAELDLLEKRVGDMQRRVTAGSASEASLRDLEREFGDASRRYEDLMAERRANAPSVAEPGGSSRESLAAVEQEMRMVEARLGVLQQKVAAGTLAPDDADLARLQGELAELQRRAAELKKK
jgi:tetratricopeptide (TPR) repeat protein